MIMWKLVRPQDCGQEIPWDLWVLYQDEQAVLVEHPNGYIETYSRKGQDEEAGAQER